MLTYEALVEQAKIREMPVTKIRGILREYLQFLVLKELYKNKYGKKLYFTGGTYLRMVHNIKRFSEDLDFNTKEITKKEFELLLETIKKELKRVGLECEVSYKHREKIYTSSLVFPAIEELYRAKSKYSRKKGIVIKVETNVPKWEIKSETSVISGFGETYPIICTEKGALFADKVDALVKKTRARHLYDIIFMLSNKYSIDERVLNTLGIKDNPLDLINTRVKSFSKSELKRQAEVLRPFLFDEEEADLIINAHDVIPPLLEQYASFIRQGHK